MTFYLVRHGQTDWNKEHRLQGQTDIPMNETGILQMKELADNLAQQDLKVDYLISSPLNRALTSAEIIAERIGFPGKVVVDEDFTERSFGLLEGVVWDYGMDFDAPEHQSETTDELCKRAEAALRKYSFREDDKIMIVAHGAILTAVRIVLSDYKLGYLDGNHQIQQGNVLCCERTPGQEPFFYDML